MRVVSTVKFGWTATDFLRRELASWASGHPLAWLALRGLWWFVTHPFHTAGLALAGWLTMGHGWWPPFAIAVGAVPPSAWASRGLLRVVRGPRVAGATGGLAETWRRLRRWRTLRRLWPIVAHNAGIVDRRRDGRVPRLGNVHATATGIAADIACGMVGVTADQVAKGAEVMAASVPGCRQVIVTPGSTPGFAHLHFMWSDPLAQVVTLDRLPVPPPGRLSFGITENGDPATIAKFKSVLIVGQSGSGKSGTLWALITSALADGVPFRLRVADPAGGVELHALKDSPFTHDYAGTPAETVKMIERMKGGMEKRLASMSGTARMHKPTRSEPWDILVIDELLLLESLLRGSNGGTASPLGQILTIGRKAGYSVWALTQVPHVDALGRVRSLFVQKLVLATDTRAMTDAVLGDGAESMGAKASKIRESTPGVGYAALEGTRGFPRFRTAWVPDDMTKLIAAGHLPDVVPRRENTPTSDRTHVMYGWYGSDDSLLYIGISNDGERRTMEHVRDKEWASEPGITMRILEQFTNRADALAAEERAIRSLRPKHNVVHNRAAIPMPPADGGV